MIIAGIRHTHRIGHQRGKRIGRHTAYRTLIQDVLSVSVGLKIVPAPAVVLLQTKSEGNAVTQYRIAHFTVCMYRSCRNKRHNQYQTQQDADPLSFYHSASLQN